MENKDIAASPDIDKDALFIRYKRERSIELRNDIVGRYIYLADILSKRFLNRGVEYEDIYQVACFALIKAVERFSPDKGVKFQSFAVPTIVGEIKRYFRDKSSAIRIPRGIYEAYQKVNEAKEQLTQELNRAPRAGEIAGHLHMDEEDVLEIIESWNVYNIQSFNQSAYEDDETELHETIGEVDNTFERIENRDFIEKSLGKFNELEMKFIRMRYYGNKPQKEIASEFGVSQMYVSRLERKVLEKFRNLLAK